MRRFVIWDKILGRYFGGGSAWAQVFVHDVEAAQLFKFEHTARARFSIASSKKWHPEFQTGEARRRELFDAHYTIVPVEVTITHRKVG